MDWKGQYNLKRGYRYLLSADVFSLLIALASLSITAKILSVEDFGLLMLVQAYIAIAGQIVSFRTVIPIVKYGVDCLSHDDRDGFISLIRIGFGIDFLSGAVGFMLAVGIAWVLSSVLAWSDTTRYLLSVYCLILLFDLTGPSIGILRIFDRFDLISLQQISFQILRLLLLMICWRQEWGLKTVAYIWIGCEIFAYLLMFILGMHQLRLQNIRLLDTVSAFAKRREFIYFTIANNINASMRIIAQNLDILLVGLFWGKSSAGSYKLAVQLGSLSFRAVQPIAQILLPKFTYLLNKGEKHELLKLMKEITLISSAVFIVIYLSVAIAGKQLIAILFGSNYSQVYDIMMVYLIAAGVATATIILIPFLYAHGLTKFCLKVEFITTLSYSLVLLSLVYFYGVYGAAISHIFYYTMLALMMWPMVKQKLASN